MPKFRYAAKDAQGVETAGVIDAVNRASALVKLRDLQLKVSTVVEDGKGGARRPGASQAVKSKGGGGGLNMTLTLRLPKFLRGRVSRKLLMTLTRQLATLNNAGVPLLRSLQILERQEKDSNLKEILHALSESVESGGTFADALSQHPKAFDKLFINMVKAGEIAGALDVSLNRLAEFIEKAEKIKTKVKGAMTYPIVVMIMALGITSFLMIGIIPKFSEIFKDLLQGAQLPALTQFVVNVSDAMVNRFPVVAGGIVALVVAVKLFARTMFGRFALDKLKLKLPVFGPILTKVAISRFSRTMGTLLNSGVQILQAFIIVRDTAGNEVVARAIQQVHNSVKEGETVAAPLEASGVFPTMVVSMIAVGEETGKLSEMLVKVADTYDTEVDAAVDGMTSIIEPLLIIFLAVIVGTIVIAMFMPLIEIITKLK